MDNLNILLLVIFLLLVILITIVIIAQYQYMRQEATVIQPAGCLGTRWGCCSDGITAKEDADGTNCQDYEMHLTPPTVPVLPTEVQKPMLPVKPPTVPLLPSMQDLKPVPKPMEVVSKPMEVVSKSTELTPPKGHEKFTNYAFI